MNLQRVAALLQDKNQVIREVVLSKAQDENQILYGSRAYNLQSPEHLRKPTTDFDLMTKKPKKTAKEIVDILKRRLPESDIVIKPATHKGTYKIVIDNVPTIDYTQIKTKPSTKKVYGVKVRSLPSIKRNATRLSRKEGLEYRREKDLDTLSKIKEIERIESYFN